MNTVANTKQVRSIEINTELTKSTLVGGKVPMEFMEKYLMELKAEYKRKSMLNNISYRFDASTSDTLIVFIDVPVLLKPWEALGSALAISEAFSQDCVAVRLRDYNHEICHESLVGRNTAPYGEFNEEYFIGW